jgi:formylglycine-generating enzyme required for sulfatase activity
MKNYHMVPGSPEIRPSPCGCPGGFSFRGLCFVLVALVAIPAAGFASPAAVMTAYDGSTGSVVEGVSESSATALALRTAELALKEAIAAYNLNNEDKVRSSGEEARRALLPLIKRLDQSNLGVWRATGVNAILLNDAQMAAAALEAIQRLRPDFADDPELLDLLAWMNRLPVQPYMAALQRDRASYIAALGSGPIPGFPYENSLGMRFVAVPGTEVKFSIWETRMKDFQAFAEANTNVHRSWENPIFGGVQVTPGPDHPVVNVSWVDAKEFCEWLTRKEQQENRLGMHQFYRLPTDREWSSAVGLECEEGDTPEARNSQVPGLYPWGRQWPPPVGAGNYADLTAKAHFPSWEVIETYRDGFATTSPVGSFAPNQFGLHDLGGNVWEWIEDRVHPEKELRVVRGGSWFNSEQQELLSSTRQSHLPTYRYDCYGFRVVLVVQSQE